MATDPDIAQTPVTSRDFAKGAGTTMLARLGAVFEIISQPVYVAMFGLAAYGLYAVLWSAITLIENIADLGMPAALQRVVPQSRSTRDQAAALRTALIVGIVPQIFVALAISLAAPLVAPIFNVAPSDAALLVDAVRIYVWTLPLWAFVEISTAALRAKRVFGAEIRLRLFWEQVFRLVISAALFIAGLGTMALFYAHIASLVLVSMLGMRLLSRHYNLSEVFGMRASADVRAKMIGAGIAVLPGNIVARLFTDGPPLLLNALLAGSAGAISAGLYVIARKISSIVQLVRTAFGYVLSPLASAASLNDVSEVRAIYAFVTRLSFALALPIGAIIIGGGLPVLRTFGADASIAMPALVILTAARVFEAVIGSAGPIQQVTGGFRSQMVGSIAGLAIALLIVLMLMPDWGLTGMAIAVGVGVAVSAVVPIYQLHIIDQLHPFAPPFTRVMLCSLAVAAGALLLAYGVAWLPRLMQLPGLIMLLLAMIWISARVSLPHDDRLTLGKVARVLRLV